MKHLSYTLLGLIIVSLFSCKKTDDADAMGSFESDEIIVSARGTGDLLQFQVEEGKKLQAGEIVGQIDDKNTELQKVQVETSIRALGEKTLDVTPQIQLLNEQLEIQKTQLANAQKDQVRIKNLVTHNAATGKQLDDVNTQVEVLRKQMDATRRQINVTKTNISTQNRSILSEKAPLDKRVSIIQDQIDKSKITNPISGIVLSKYALIGEFVTIGKPLYKIANTDEVYLRAYLDQTLLSSVKLGQQVKVRIDDKDDYKHYDGTITWISNQAEFTPKTIQTREERENLVYAIKVKVKNDGGIKLGMYGEMLFK